MKSVQLTIQEYYNLVELYNISFDYVVSKGYVIITADISFLKSLGF